MFSLTILTLPSSSLAISSSAGAICRQGPHHSAQKSTTTGVDDFKTSAAKVSSETVAVAMYLLLLGRRHFDPQSGRSCGTRANLGAHPGDVKAGAFLQYAAFGQIKQC